MLNWQRVRLIGILWVGFWMMAWIGETISNVTDALSTEGARVTIGLIFPLFALPGVGLILWSRGKD